MHANLRINGRAHKIDVSEDMPLLWVLRDILGLKGTKFGCGIAACGACTVHVDGVATRSCSVPATALDGAAIETIEGLDDAVGKALQSAWITHEVSQCGYCQSGQLMSAAALLRENPHVTDADIALEMAGNLCRCGTYPRIKSAIKSASAALLANERPSE
ncbi:MAG: (2Fe-2S)-binding protein [Pseudomonadota bacterium]